MFNEQRKPVAIYFQVYLKIFITNIFFVMSLRSSFIDCFSCSWLGSKQIPKSFNYYKLRLVADDVFVFKGAL